MTIENTNAIKPEGNLVLFVCGVAVFVQSLPDDERDEYGMGSKGQGRR